MRGSLGDAVRAALQEEDSPSTESVSGLPMKRDRSFSEQDLAQFQSELGGGHTAPKVLESLDPEPRPRSGTPVLPQAQSCIGIPIPQTLSVPALSTAHPMSYTPCPHITKGHFAVLSSQHLLEELCVAVCPHCVLLVSHHAGSVPASYHPVPYGSAPRAALSSVEEKPEDGSSTAPSSSSKHLWLVSARLELRAWPRVRAHSAGFVGSGHATCGSDGSCLPQEFSHPVESLALTVEEMINVRRVLVKAEMEKFLQSKELYNSLKKGKVGTRTGGLSCSHAICTWCSPCLCPQVCCCCRAKFPLFSWPAACLFCKR